MGSDVARVLIGQEIYEGDPSLDDEYHRKERIARQVIRAVSDLHQIGVVHADIHAGNVGLPPPSDESLTTLLANPPREDNVVRKDGQPTPPTLPQRVTEPEYIGYGPEDSCTLFDFGYSFRPSSPGVLYDNSVFPRGTPLPPEILRDGDKTAHPFKVDSWQLGIFVSWEDLRKATYTLSSNSLILGILHSVRPSTAL
jgi:serine/threonine protein kinase